MKYRKLSNPNDFARDVSAVVRLLGERDYLSRLQLIGKSLNMKGYVTPNDDLRFSLERDLLSLELTRRQRRGRFDSYPLHLHEASDFIIGLGQTIQTLSERAKRKVKSQIWSGLKTNGLRPLQHEMRVASILDKFGCEFAFADLEQDKRFDFLAEKDGLEFEVEAKCLNVFTGHPLAPQDADKFFHEIRRRFLGAADKKVIPALDVMVSHRLPTNLNDLWKLVDACSAVVNSRETVDVMGIGSIKFVGMLPDFNRDAIATAFELDSRISDHLYLSRSTPKAAIRLRSQQRTRFREKIITTVSEAAKKQFTGARPGIVWTHVNYVSPEVFDALSYATEGQSLFDTIAERVFGSPKRNHVSQLVFTGGSHLRMTEGIAQSSYRRVVYNSDCSRFANSLLIPEGKQAAAWRRRG